MSSTRQRVRRGILLLLFLAFPIIYNYYSPYLIMQGASEGVANFSFFLWSAWALTALFIGRIGCAYVCPLGAAQMISDKVLERPLVRVKYFAVVKYVLAVAWVAGIVLAAIAGGGYKSANLLYMTESGISADSLLGLLMYYFLIAIPLLPAALLGRRAFCHYLCPFGVVNMATSKLGQWLRLPQLHLAANTAACTQCQRCTQACPMSLPVTDMVQRGDMTNHECILCATCADGCPRHVIRYAWGRPQR